MEVLAGKGAIPVHLGVENTFTHHPSRPPPHTPGRIFAAEEHQNLREIIDEGMVPHAISCQHPIISLRAVYGKV